MNEDEKGAEEQLLALAEKELGRVREYQKGRLPPGERGFRIPLTKLGGAVGALGIAEAAAKEKKEGQEEPGQSDFRAREDVRKKGSSDREL